MNAWPPQKVYLPPKPPLGVGDVTGRSRDRSVLRDDDALLRFVGEVFWSEHEAARGALGGGAGARGGRVGHVGVLVTVGRAQVAVAHRLAAVLAPAPPRPHHAADDQHDEDDDDDEQAEADREPDDQRRVVGGAGVRRHELQTAVLGRVVAHRHLYAVA